MLDLAIIGAGPIGLEAAILAQRQGLNYTVFEKGCIVNAIYNYPTYMTFFTTSERLEIGGHPLITATDKPTRKEALDYYRKVSINEALNIKQYSEVTKILPSNKGFQLTITPKRGEIYRTDTLRVVIATGYFDNPKMLNIPGEQNENVSHYYTESHSFYNRNVTIIGAGSSAADAALDLFKSGARVTMIHRGDDFRHSLKYWIRPNLENRVKEGSITAHFNTVVKEITADEVIAYKLGQEIHIPTEQTFALTGYYASPKLLEQVGVKVNSDDFSAKLNPKTFETNVEGLYIIGSAGFGQRTSDVFIENGLVHARKAFEDIGKKFKSEKVNLLSMV